MCYYTIHMAFANGLSYLSFDDDIDDDDDIVVVDDDEWYYYCSIEKGFNSILIDDIESLPSWIFRTIACRLHSYEILNSRHQ